MRRFALILTLVLTACNAARTPLSLQVVSSEMARCPEGSYLDGQAGNLKWNYTTGLELKAFLDVYDTYGGEQILQYVDGWYDAVIDSAGIIYKYKKSNFSTDHICPGRTLFRLYGFEIIAQMADAASLAGGLSGVAHGSAVPHHAVTEVV